MRRSARILLLASLANVASLAVAQAPQPKPEAGAPAGQASPVKGVAPKLKLSDCRLRVIEGRWQGSCGPLFDENPTFAISRAKSITSGIWRKDTQPTEVWAGTMTTEDDPQAPLEIEIYTGGTGVLRTPYGWFPVSGFTPGEATLGFQVDGANEVPASALDREILRRAATILATEAVWNRADDRQCPPSATTWSIYCATERATIEITGAFHHRRPALQLVRQIVDERTKGRPYAHRLMDYNNDPSTHLENVRSLFAEALARIP